MNKRFTTILAVLLILFTASMVIGCNNPANPEPTPDTTPPPDSPVFIAKIVITETPELLTADLPAFKDAVLGSAKTLTGDETTTWVDSEDKTINTITYVGDKSVLTSKKNTFIAAVKAKIQDLGWSGKAEYLSETKTINISVTGFLVKTVTLVSKGLTLPSKDSAFDVAVKLLKADAAHAFDTDKNTIIVDATEGVTITEADFYDFLKAVDTVLGGLEPRLKIDKAAVSIKNDAGAWKLAVIEAPSSAAE